ncbi:FtsX-like permease family protein [Dactylosporangium sp. NPDC005572]|uniref:ABC transporter permease n=1 Tax=Dactylosporangium sp. NPDC005572 TaxID=3156889 RepID=UPI0033B7E9FB
MIRLSGRLRSAVIIGGQGIRARKMRTFLSMLSLFLGVLAVVAVQAAAETAKTLRLADLELHAGKDGTRQLYVPPMGDAVSTTFDTIAGRPGVAAMMSYQAIIGEPKVTPINPGAAPFNNEAAYGYGPMPGSFQVQCDSSGLCRPVPVDAGDVPPKGQAIEVVLNAVSGDVRQFRPFRPVSGSWLDESGPPSYSPRLVLNKEAARGFSEHVVPAEMRMDGATANPTPRIIGVVDDGNPQPTAYVRMDDLRNWLPSSAGSSQYGGGLLVLLSPSAGETERLLVHKLTSAGLPGEALQVQVVDARKTIESELSIVRWIFLGMAGLVLLIGVAGILNVGLATVGERVEEFALRRAVGTPRSLLAGIVLAETLLTGLLTAAAAIGLSVVALDVASAMFAYRFPELRDMTFPWQAGVAGVIAGLVAGLLGGAIPAARAARIPIATVMRA